MINNKKVELMSKVALYEHSEGKQTIRLNKYFKQDYATTNMLRSAPLGFICVILIVALMYIVKEDWVSSLIRTIGGVATIIVIIVTVVVFIALYCLFSQYMFNHKYENFRGNLRTYGLYLRRLEKIYDEENEKKEV